MFSKLKKNEILIPIIILFFVNYVSAEEEDVSLKAISDQIQEITNDIVQLIAASPQAMEDFATIATQQDVDQFNKKYNVNLVLPQEA